MEFHRIGIDGSIDNFFLAIEGDPASDSLKSGTQYQYFSKNWKQRGSLLAYEQWIHYLLCEPGILCHS